MKQPVPPKDMSDKAAVDKFLSDSTAFQADCYRVSERNMKIAMTLMILAGVIQAGVTIYRALR